MSVLNQDLTLNVKKTVEHAEMVINHGCHGVAVFGSTGQSQLIPVSEKIGLLNHLASSVYKERYIIGTGLNSLGETINLMRVALSLNFKNFLIMPPAYYKYGDEEVINFYTKIVEAIPESRIIELTIKLNKINMDAIVKDFERYDYNIIASYKTKQDESDFLDRYESLMRFLNP